MISTKILREVAKDICKLSNWTHFDTIQVSRVNHLSFKVKKGGGGWNLGNIDVDTPPTVNSITKKQKQNKNLQMPLNLQNVSP